jgi:hypothetical protein
MRMYDGPVPDVKERFVSIEELVLIVGENNNETE